MIVFVINIIIKTTNMSAKYIAVITVIMTETSHYSFSISVLAFQ